MASVSKRRTAKGDRWDVRFRDPSGKQRCETWATAADARRRAAELEVQLVRGDWIDPTGADLIVVELWDRYVASIRPTLSASTIAWLDAARLALGALGERPIGEVTRDEVRAWVDSMTAKAKPGAEALKAKPATVRPRLARLRAAFAFGIAEGLIRTNPTDGVRPPKPAEADPVFLTAVEVARLAEAVDQRYRGWVLVACWCGLRFSELAGLRWSDVDLDRATITVRSQAARTPTGAVERRATKTAKSKRTIVMPRVVVERLVVERPAHVDRETLVFPAPDGGFLNGPTFIRRFFRPAATTIGRPELTPHHCRHTAASLAIASGATVTEVMQLLGHTTPRLTLGLYGHLMPEAGHTLAARLDALAAGAVEQRD